jgi:hypothetical protein
MLGVLALRGSASAQDAVLLDGLAAVVGGTAPGAGVDAILQSDVELRARIALVSHGANPHELDAIPTTLLHATLQEIIGEHLIAREAKRVQAATPTARDVEQERGGLVRSVGGNERMRALLDTIAASGDELAMIAQRRALVGAFLSANLEGVTEITDSEVQRAMHEDPDAGPDTPGARSEMRSLMARAALDKTIARWVAVLRLRTPMRVYVAY